jgi:hypothetical protein
MRFQIQLGKNATFSTTKLDQQLIPFTDKQVQRFKLMIAMQAKEMRTNSTTLRIK